MQLGPSMDGPRWEMFQTNLPPHLAKFVWAQVEKTDSSRSEFLRELVKQAYEKHKKNFRPRKKRNKVL